MAGGSCRPIGSAPVGLVAAEAEERAAAAESARELAGLGPRGAGGRLLVVALLLVGVEVAGLLAGEADLPLAAVDAEDLHLDLVAHLDHVLRALDLVVGQLGDVEQALQARLQL